MQQTAHTPPHLRKFVRKPLLALALAWVTPQAQAELMDDIEVRREGNNAVVLVKMATPVNFQRFTTSRSNDLTQAYYQVRRRELTNLEQLVVQGERRVVDAEGLPRITIADEPVRPDLLQDTNRRLVIGFSKSVKFKVRTGKGDRSIEVVLDGLGPMVKGVLLPKAPAQPTQQYVIALLRSPYANLQMETPVPAALQNMQVFTTRRIVNGEQVFELDLGYFTSLGEAEAALGMVRPRFPLSTIVKLGTHQEPTATAAPRPQGAAPQDDSGEGLMQTARQAYETQRYDDAAEALNKVLDLPASPLTPQAQALLGGVRMAQGDPTRAALEYETFLKLYPGHPAAERVQGELAQARAALQPQAAAEAKKPDGTPTVTGSVSQYYYGGKSTSSTQAVRDTDGTLLTPDQISQRSTAPISSTDQKMLSTNMDTTWRSRNTERDIRMVVRDQFDYNMIDESRLRGRSRYRNRLTAAFFDYQSLTDGYRTRLGRQSAAWGGEGRYDGASGSYAFKTSSKLKLSTALGMPTDKLAQAKRQFAGLSLDADAITPNIGASVFAVQRNIDGEVDRRAAGVDLRYFTQNGSLMASSDYDVVFRRMNVASLQGLYINEGNFTLNTLIERRSLAQASLGQTLFFQFQDPNNPGNIIPLAQTIGDMERTGKSLSELRELVRRNMSYASHAMTSITVPLNPQWQIGTDLHLNRIGAIAPNEVLPTGLPASGLQRTVGLQAIGSNLLAQRDTHVFAGSVLTSSQFKVRQISYNNLTALDDAWQVEPSVRWQKSVSAALASVAGSVETTTTAWGPGLKLSFKPRQSVTLESNLNVDFTHTIGINDDKATRYTYFLGYRYDY